MKKETNNDDLRIISSEEQMRPLTSLSSAASGDDGGSGCGSGSGSGIVNK